MSQGSMGGLTKAKGRQSRKNAAYYDRQEFVTLKNKRKRATRLKAWLEKRQSIVVTQRMYSRWAERHPVNPLKPMIDVRRYGWGTTVNPKFKKEAA